MPIESVCDRCEARLRVADEHAGKKARCPQCGNVYVVPDQTAGDLLHTPQAPLDVWSVRLPDGQVFGPVARAELEKWHAEGRVPPQSHLRREGTGDWIPSTQVFPPHSPVQQTAAAANPFADANPYYPSSAPTAGGMYQQPHRGGTILALGIIGIVICGLAAPIAWILGQQDLTTMRLGRMDPTGRGLTQAGMVLGIIGTALLVLGCGFGLLIAMIGA